MLFSHLSEFFFFYKNVPFKFRSIILYHNANLMADTTWFLKDPQLFSILEFTIFYSCLSSHQWVVARFCQAHLGCFFFFASILWLPALGRPSCLILCSFCIFTEYLSNISLGCSVCFLSLPFLMMFALCLWPSRSLQLKSQPFSISLSSLPCVLLLSYHWKPPHTCLFIGTGHFTSWHLFTSHLPSFY